MARPKMFYVANASGKKKGMCSHRYLPCARFDFVVDGEVVEVKQYDLQE